MKQTGRVLVVDDEKNITTVMQAMLERAGYEALTHNDSAEAIRAIDESVEAEDLNLVVTDLYMPGPGGMEILEHCKRNHPQLPVVIITAFGTVESAVTALKRGAFGEKMRVARGGASRRAAAGSSGDASPEAG